MIKTLLAGALLSTGLVAGGAAGADDAKMDNLKSNENGSNQVITQSADGTTSFSQKFDLPKDAVPATPKGDVKTVEKSEGTGTDSQEGKMVPTNEGTESQPGFEMGAPEKPEHAKTVERTEGTGTDSQQGKMVPTKEEN
ncbi:alpha-ketoglutarate permease [Bacillus cereus]|uniref:alpha-ketoglutarate permease n=1 Tax=Bacillus cereus TaxID=1396 RepID=UPI000BF6DFDA|nr:alpha-ketoglutarate permease [Bacillus cereus]MEB9370569.1 alpha-ketoglutarate permease [Bacillus cereus]PES48985.1 alpha-ketoglutarate permease [Bacillus cereus]PFD47798.1 alpha-ketoglutarate permease [Bacillus cereus]PFI09009.1 alpha-ketoglutarate permease [Bacillus cereus]PFJ15141.1 alpha-ketoglutarate permease [Bacillus cereus]